MPNDAEYEKWLAEHLPGYRDKLTKGCLSKNAVDAFIRIAWTPPAITISTVEDYRRACLAHAEMAKSVRRGDWQSPAAVRLHT